MMRVLYSVYVNPTFHTGANTFILFLSFILFNHWLYCGCRKLVISVIIATTTDFSLLYNASGEHY